MPDIQLSINSMAASGANLTPAGSSNEETVAKYHELEATISSVFFQHPAARLRTSNCSNSTFVKLWLHHLKQIIPDVPVDRVIFRNHSLTMTGDQIESIKNREGDPRPMFNPKDYFSTSGDSFNYNTIHVKRGLGIMDVIKTHAEQYYNLRHIADIGVHVTLTSSHKIDIYEMTDRFGILVVTNYNEEELVPRILGTVWSYLNAYDLGTKLRAAKIAETPFLQVAKFLYRSSLDDYLAFAKEMQAWLEGRMNTREYIAEMFEGYQEQLTNQLRRSFEQQKQRLTNEISNYESSLASAYQNLESMERDNMVRILGLEGEDNKLKELIDFIFKSKGAVRVINFDKQSSRMLVDITTPISNYRIKDIEMYYKRPGGNYVTNHAVVREAFRKCFVDQEYDLMTTTRVSIKLTGSDVSGVRDSASDTNSIGNTNLRFGNPHIQGFDCFRNYKTEINKALATANYINAFAALIHACSTITFTDGAVISNFTSRVKDDRHKKLFRRKSDGLMFSAEDIYQAVQEAEAAAKTEEVPTL